VFLSNAIESKKVDGAFFSSSSLFALPQGSVLRLRLRLRLFSIIFAFFSLFFLCKTSASGRSPLISVIVSPSFLSELQAFRHLFLAYGRPLPSEYPTWLLDPGVVRRVRNSSGQQMRNCTLFRGVESASGLTVSSR